MLWGLLLAFGASVAFPAAESDRLGLNPGPIDPPHDSLIPANPFVKDCASGRADLESMPFLIVDSRQGDSFSVEILYGIVPPHPIRVAWGAQIPRTHEGVTIYFRTDGGAWNFRDLANGLGGGCGQTAGQARESSAYTVQVDFGGMDVETSSKHGYTHTRSITLGVEGTFNIGVGAGFTGGSITVKYDDTNTWTIAEEFTVTTHGYKKTFLQDYPNDLSSPQLWGCKQVVCEDLPA